MCPQCTFMCLQRTLTDSYHRSYPIHFNHRPNLTGPNCLNHLKIAPMDVRSALFMPGSNARALAKSAALKADAIIIDLEDSVAPSLKALARDQAAKALQQTDYGYRIKALRINADNPQWQADDLAAAAIGAPDAIVLPKVRSASDIARLSDDMSRFAALDGCAIWAMIETPQALINANDIAASADAHPRLKALLIGINDLALACGTPMQAERSYFIPWLMSLVLAAKAHGLLILDSVFNDINDPAGFGRECKQGFDMGMNGKTLIHPSQLDTANAAFTPSLAAVEHAREVVRAFAQPENADKGVISVRGLMTERLHLEMANELLQRVERLDARK